MARVPEELVRRLKREVSIERLVEASGVELSRHGSDRIGLCPFHDDTEPSLVVTPSKNLWHCLGACNAGGSVIDWVMKAEGVSFRHAVELLREGLAPEVSGEGPPPKVSTVRRLESPVSADASERELLGQVAAYYHGVLRESADARAYLEQRGVGDEEAIAHFDLGFADRTLGLRLEARTRKAGAELRDRLEQLGVYRESGHEHLTGCVVFPIRDAGGAVVNLYGRRIGKVSRGAPSHLYLPGPRRGLWNREAFGGEELVLCESLIDALTFWCAGFRQVTAAWGVNGFTEEHGAAIAAGAVKRVLIAYDRDEAGERGARELAQKLGGQGIGCFRVAFPRGMDANEYALKVRPAAESLGLALRSAEWLAGPTRRVAVAVPASASKPPATPAEAPPPVAPASSTSSAPSPPFLAAGRAEAAPPAPEPPPAAPLAPAPDPLPPPLPASPGSVDPLEVSFGDRRYRVRGLAANLSYERLKVLVRVAHGEGFFVDSVDLVSARRRVAFIEQAAAELGVKSSVIKRDLGRLHLRLEALQDELIQRALRSEREAPVALSGAEEREALELLRSPGLLDRIVADFDRCGVVGEQINMLAGYLAAVSRKLDRPLAVVVQSSSAAGKSALMEAVLSFVPPEEKVSYSAMTGQSLFYMGETDLAHKVLAIAEEEGAERASYALKLLQSEGELTIASTGKDPESGRLVTHEYRVEGPVAILLTTTSIEVDEELLNRAIVLSVDEDREQTRAIHRRQREAETLPGLLAGRERERIVRLHQNAQRLLRPLAVVNPYARELTFLDDRTRTRRDHVKYLALIRTIALLHQHQRPVRTVRHRGEELAYIEVEPADVEAANRLAHEVLGRSLDELPPQTRRLLGLLDRRVRERCAELKVERSELRFTRREVRGWTGWGLSQLRVHLGRLVEMEYLLVHRGGRGQSFVYELLYDGGGEDGRPHLPGLLDPKALRRREEAGTGSDLAGSEADLAGSKRGQTGPVAAPRRAGSAPANPSSGEASGGPTAKSSKTHGSGTGKNGAPGAVPRAVAAAGRPR